MIARKDIGDGRTAFGVWGAGALVKLISKEGAVKSGDLIDVFGGTVQLVRETQHLGFPWKKQYEVTTLTANDNRELEVISYVIVGGNITSISKRKGDMNNPQDRQYSEEYWGALGAA